MDSFNQGYFGAYLGAYGGMSLGIRKGSEWNGDLNSGSMIKGVDVTINSMTSNADAPEDEGSYLGASERLIGRHYISDLNGATVYFYSYREAALNGAFFVTKDTSIEVQEGFEYKRGFHLFTGEYTGSFNPNERWVDGVNYSEMALTAKSDNDSPLDGSFINKAVNFVGKYLQSFHSTAFIQVVDYVDDDTFRFKTQFSEAAIIDGFRQTSKWQEYYGEWTGGYGGGLVLNADEDVPHIITSSEQNRKRGTFSGLAPPLVGRMFQSSANKLRMAVTGEYNTESVKGLFQNLDGISWADLQVDAYEGFGTHVPWFEVNPQGLRNSSYSDTVWTNGVRTDITQFTSSGNGANWDAADRAEMIGKSYLADNGAQVLITQATAANNLVYSSFNSEEQIQIGFEYPWKWVETDLAPIVFNGDFTVGNWVLGLDQSVSRMTSQASSVAGAYFGQATDMLHKHFKSVINGAEIYVYGSRYDDLEYLTDNTDEEIEQGYKFPLEFREVPDFFVGNYNLVEGWVKGINTGAFQLTFAAEDIFEEGSHAGNVEKLLGKQLISRTNGVYITIIDIINPYILVYKSEASSKLIQEGFEFGNDFIVHYGDWTGDYSSGAWSNGLYVGSAEASNHVLAAASNRNIKMGSFTTLGARSKGNMFRAEENGLCVIANGESAGASGSLYVDLQNVGLLDWTALSALFREGYSTGLLWHETMIGGQRLSSLTDANFTNGIDIVNRILDFSVIANDHVDVATAKLLLGHKLIGSNGATLFANKMVAGSADTQMYFISDFDDQMILDIFSYPWKFDIFVETHGLRNGDYNEDSFILGVKWGAVGFGEMTSLGKPFGSYSGKATDLIGRCLQSRENGKKIMVNAATHEDSSIVFTSYDTEEDILYGFNYNAAFDIQADTFYITGNLTSGDYVNGLDTANRKLSVLGSNINTEGNWVGSADRLLGLVLTGFNGAQITITSKIDDNHVTYNTNKAEALIREAFEWPNIWQEFRDNYYIHTLQPLDVEANEGETAEFSVVVSGSNRTVWEYKLKGDDKWIGFAYYVTETSLLITDLLEGCSVRASSWNTGSSRPATYSRIAKVSNHYDYFTMDTDTITCDSTNVTCDKTII